MVSALRFGEMYELRFQPKGSKHQSKESPEALNSLHLDESDPELADPDNNLDDYFIQNNLKGLIYWDTYSDLRPDNLEEGLDAYREGRWTLVTDGPQDQTLSRLNALFDGMQDSMEQVKAGRRDPREHTLELIKRYITNFPAKVPQLVLQYTTRQASPEEAAARTFGDDTLPASLLTWTNRAEVLQQIQADRIDKQDPRALDTNA